MGIEEPNNRESNVESNETAENLEDLKQEVLDGYDQKEIENYPDGEKGLFRDVRFLRESIGKRFIDSFVKGSTVEVGGSTFKTEKIDLGQLRELAEEMRQLESEKDVEVVDNIVLTLDELKELEELISSNSTKEELDAFLKEQLKENYSSVQAFGKDNLEEFGKYFEKEGAEKKVLNLIDNGFSDIIKKRVGVLSEDVTRNMGTGMTLAMFELYKDMGKDVENFFKKMNEGDFNLEKIQEFLQDADKSKMERVTGFFDILNDGDLQEKINDGEKNMVLSNPYKFKELYLEYLRGDKNEQEVREAVKMNQDSGYKFEGLSEKEQKQVQNTVKDAVEKMDPETAKGLEGIFGSFGSLENMKSGIKEKIQQNSGKILGIVGSVPFLKDIFNTFLDWFGLSVEQLEEKHNGESLDSGKRKAINELFDNYQGKVKKLDDGERQEENIFEDIDTNSKKDILKNFDVESFREIIKDYDFSDLEDKREGKYSLPMDFLIEEGFVEEGKDSSFNEEEALNKFIKKYTEKFLSDEDISENIDSGKDLAYLLLNKYVDFSEEVEESEIKGYKNWEKFMKNASFEGMINSKGSAFSEYKGEIQSTCDELGIPPKVLLALFIKEGSEGDVESSPGSSSAMGLGQITDSTRKEITNNLAGDYLDSSEIPDEWQRTNAAHQIKASAVYLKYWYEQTGNWLDAIVNYHSGGGPDSEEEMQEWLDKNPAVAQHVPSSANLSFRERYKKGVSIYYSSRLA